MLGTRHALSLLDVTSINIGDAKIVPAEDAKNIGFVFDQVMDSKKHILSLCKSAWYQLKSVAKIRNVLDQKSTERLIHAFVSSGLDINNALLYGLPDSLILKLQRLQNASARLILKIRKHDHITPALIKLHWLPVKSRIHFKIILLVYKALNGLAPGYISDMLQHKTHAYSTRTSSHLIVPRFGGSYGKRNFRCVAPKLWNDLPEDLKTISSLSAFKQGLKTHLFRRAFVLQ